MLRSTPAEPLKPRVNPPHSVHHDRRGEAFGQMFGAYLRKVQDYHEEKCHPLSATIRSVLRSSASIIQDESLALGVAVESLLREYFAAAGEPDADSVAAADAAMAHLDSWSGPEAIRQRIHTCIGHIKGANPRTAIRTLVSNGTILDRHRDAWEELRNTATHGLVSDDDVHHLVELCDTVHQLFVLLVFAIVDYTGPFTDYCTPGYPCSHFPLGAGLESNDLPGP